jgi:hypothetical protein
MAFRALACAAAGLVAGWLLHWLYYALQPELAPLAANRRVADALRPMLASIESARFAAYLLGLLVTALPGGIALGALAGYAMARVRAPRVLCYAALGWPAWVLASSQYHYAVTTAGQSAVQYWAWQVRNLRLADVAAMLIVFFLVAYAARRLFAGRVIKSAA